MINSLVKIGIICPCNIEYQSCKEILKLHNETELAGRLISSRKGKDVEVIAIQANPGKIQCASAAQLNGIKCFSFRVITDNADEEMKDNLNVNWEKALEIMFKALNKFIFKGWINKILFYHTADKSE